MAVVQSALKFYFPITSMGNLLLNGAKCRIQYIKKKTQQQQKKHLRRERKEKHFESESPPVCYWRVYQSKAQHIWDLNAVLLQIHSFYEK